MYIYCLCKTVNNSVNSKCSTISEQYNVEDRSGRQFYSGVHQPLPSVSQVFL